MTKTPSKLRSGKPDFSLLSDAEKKLLREKAQAIIEAEARQITEDAYLQEMLADEKRLARFDPNEEQVVVQIDLAPHADRIRIDDEQFYHGQSYTVPRRQFDTLKEIMARTWGHEYQTGHANIDNYRKPANTTLRPGMESVTTRQLLRV